jgi:hypothetical protein
MPQIRTSAHKQAMRICCRVCPAMTFVSHSPNPILGSDGRCNRVCCHWPSKSGKISFKDVPGTESVIKTMQVKYGDKLIHFERIAVRKAKLWCISKIILCF